MFWTFKCIFMYFTACPTDKTSPTANLHQSNAITDKELNDGKVVVFSLQLIFFPQNAHSKINKTTFSVN